MLINERKYISAKAITDKAISNLCGLVVMCSEDINGERFIESGYGRLSLNVRLARLLVDSPIGGQRVSDCVKSFFQSGTKIYLADYEMLFDPRYGIDALRLLQDVARTTNVVLKWCGVYANGLLIYAEEGYSDYRRFDLNKYQLTCII